MKTLRTTPDPNLQAAMEEIKVILKKHDAAGVVILNSVDAMEYLIEVEASWSCAHLEQIPDTNFAGIRVRTTDIADVATKKAALEATLGMFLGTVEVMGNVADQLLKIVNALQQKIGPFEHETKRL